MKKDDYRDRFYSRYITGQWQYMEEFSRKSFELRGSAFERYILPFLPSDKSLSILDAACGPGHLLYFLQKRGYPGARGIDLGDEQLEAGRKMGVINTEKADIFDYLKGGAKKFDVIIALAVIEHFSKEEAVRLLDLAYNSLNPEGRIIVSTCNVMSLFDLECTFGDFTHEIVFTPRSLGQLLRNCNFKDVQVRGIAPFAYDIRSGIRSFLWKCLKTVLKTSSVIACGTGRSIWKFDPIFESMILGVGRK